MLLNWLPQSLMVKKMILDEAYRPQANFVPQVTRCGNGPLVRQKPSKRLQKQKDDQDNIAHIENATAVTSAI